MAKLVAEEGSLKGLVLALEEGDEWIIGRDPDACQLLVEDPLASRKHLLCRKKPEGIEIENLSTTNPVLVNQEEVTTPKTLKHGDSVKIGSGIFRFYTEMDAKLFTESEEKSPETSKDVVEAKEKKDSEDIEEKHDIKDTDAESAEGEQDIEAEKPEDKPQEEKDIKDTDTESAEGEQDIETENPEDEPQEKKDTKDTDAESAEGEQDIETEKREEETEKEIGEEGKEEKLTMDEAMQEKSKEEMPSGLEATEGEAKEGEEKTIKTQDELEQEAPSRRDTIFEEEAQEDLLAKIDFDIAETGRWLLKVINGPNNGAEFMMQPGKSYLVGTDPNSCDVVFHDTSVSRQHCKITINEDDQIVIEDLKSRNGTLIDGDKIPGSKKLEPNSVVTLGTTSFVLFDREGEMKTIISPLLPSIVKVLQKEKEEEKAMPEVETVEAAKAKETKPETPKVTITKKELKEKAGTTLTAFILIAILTGVFAVMAIGTIALFQTKPIQVQEVYDSDKMLTDALTPFSGVEYNYNKNSGTLLLVGHVLTETAKKQLLYNIQGLQSIGIIKNLDDSGVVVDEYVWKEINPLLSRNPKWRRVSIQATFPGNFVMVGNVENRQDMESLQDYIQFNFPNLDLIENKVTIEEDVITTVKLALADHDMRNLDIQMSSGELILKGSIPNDKKEVFDDLLEDFRSIPGVRQVQDFVSQLEPEKAIINITDRYEVSGVSRTGSGLNVIIDGRIVSKGDIIDGMKITEITPQTMFLEQDNTKYKINIQ